MNLVARLLLETSGFVRPAEQAIAPLQRVKGELAGVAREADRVAASRGSGGGGALLLGGGGGSGSLAATLGTTALALGTVRSQTAAVAAEMRRATAPVADLRLQMRELFATAASGGGGGRRLINVTGTGAADGGALPLRDRGGVLALENGSIGGLRRNIDLLWANQQARTGETKWAPGASPIAAGLRSNIAQAMAPLAALSAAYGSLRLVGGALSRASESEDAATSLTTLLGSAEAAQRRLAELQQFAKTTPFELPEVVKASRVLETLTGGALATGDGLRLVGDVAANVQQPIQELAVWFGRLYDGLQTGRPVGEAMMRLQELGVISGDTRSHLEELQAQGRRGAEVWDVAAASFARFAGEMERRSATVSGRASNLKDAFGGLGREVGGLFLPAVNQELKRTTSLLEGMTGYLGMVKDYWLDAFGGVSAGRMAALFPAPAGGAKPPTPPRGTETDIRKSLTTFFGPIDEIGEASRVLRESFGQFRQLNLERVLNDPFASDAMRRRALDAQARDAFRAGGLADRVAPGIIALPAGVDATVERVKAELELIEAMKIEGKLTTDAAEKARRLVAVYQELRGLSNQLEAIKQRGVEKRLGEFFGEMDGTNRRPAAEIPMDRLSRIGLMIGTGGPANEHARRTAIGIEKLVTITERRLAQDAGIRDRNDAINLGLRARAAQWE